MRHSITAYLLACFCVSSICQADDSATLNDDTNFQGDRLSWPVNINFKDEKDNEVCIPAGTTLFGLGKLENERVPVYTSGSPNVDKFFTRSTPTPCADDSQVKPSTRVNVPKEYLTGYGLSRYGITYGALIVPYKYQFQGSKNFDGSATLGPYVGYRFDRGSWGFGAKAVAFAGLSAISVTRTDEEGNSNDDTLAGFSYGVGLIGEIKGDFQLGVVVGQDKVSDGSDYEDDGKWWGAVAIGFSFAN